MSKNFLALGIIMVLVLLSFVFGERPPRYEIGDSSRFLAYSDGGIYELRAAIYEKDTGRIINIIWFRFETPSEFLKIKERYEMDPYIGLYSLENYPLHEIEAIQMGLMENPYSYVFDPEENRVREATIEEREKLRARVEGLMTEGVSTIVSCVPQENLTRIDVLREGKGFMAITLRTSNLLKISVELGKQLSIMLFGLKGTTGTIEIQVSREYISPEEFEIYIDNIPLDNYVIYPSGPDSYYIRAGYSHSVHTITMMGLIMPHTGLGFLGLILLTVSIVIAIGALYLLKFRRSA